MRVTASGRTDAGVHALGQVVSFHSGTRLAADVLQQGAQRRAAARHGGAGGEEAAADFHAIASAVRKRYRYRIDDGPIARRFRAQLRVAVSLAARRSGHAPRGTGARGQARFQQLRNARVRARDRAVRTVFEISVERMRRGRPAAACRSKSRPTDSSITWSARSLVRWWKWGGGRRSEAWPAEVLAARDRKAAGRTAPAARLVSGARLTIDCAASENDCRMRIAHVITRLILGGAQENTVLTCEDLLRIHGDEVLLITGPPVGPEGSLMDRVVRSGVPIEVAAGAAPRNTSAERPARLFSDQAGDQRFPARRRPHAQRQGRIPGTSGGACLAACPRSCIRFTARRFIRIRAGGRSRFCAGASATPPTAAMRW